MSISLFGGEPLLYFYENLELLKYVKSLCEANEVKFTTSIITNASLITKEVVEDLKSINCAYAQITFDGTEEFHNKRRKSLGVKDTFNDVFKGLVTLKENAPDIYTNIRINYDKNSYTDVKEMLGIISKYNFKNYSIAFGNLTVDEDTQKTHNIKCLSDYELAKHSTSLYDKMVDLDMPMNNNINRILNFCLAHSINYYIIGPKAELFKCMERTKAEDIIGYIDESGNITEKNDNYNFWLEYNLDKTKNCKSCEYLPLCMGGCTSRRYNKMIISGGCYDIKDIYHYKIKNLYNYS